MVRRRDLGDVVKGRGGKWFFDMPKQPGDGSERVVMEIAITSSFSSGSSNLRYGFGSRMVSPVNSEKL